MKLHEMLRDVRTELRGIPPGSGLAPPNIERFVQMFLFTFAGDELTLKQRVAVTKVRLVGAIMRREWEAGQTAYVAAREALRSLSGTR